MQPEPVENLADTVPRGKSKPPSPVPVIPGYLILAPLGRGGMGEVWRARQLATGKEVALKVLQRETDPELLVRFERESAAMGVLDHPYIVKLLGRGRAEKALFYAMELVNGPTLRVVHAREPLPPSAALRVVADVAAALAHAHRLGIVHRDLKPENILIASDGHPRIVDFGIASAHAYVAEQLTGTGSFFGTPDYAAPEQRRSTRRANYRSDIYSIGVVLYELLCGDLPQGRFTLPSQRVKDLDPRIDPIVSRALAQNPNERFGSAGELQAALEQLIRGGAPVPVHSAIPSTSDQDPIRVSWEGSCVEVHVHGPPRGKDLEQALRQVQAWTSAGHQSAIGYELEHPDSLNDEASEGFERLHQKARPHLARVGFAARIPLVRAAAAALAGTIPQLEAGVFSSTLGMRRWLGAVRRSRRILPYLSRRPVRFDSHVPAVVLEAIKTRGILAGSLWAVGLFARMTLAGWALGSRDVELVSGVASLLNGASHCAHHQLHAFNRDFLAATGRPFSLHEHQLLALTQGPDEELCKAVQGALHQAELPEQAAMVQELQALMNDPEPPRTRRGRHLLAVVEFTEAMNRVCVAEQRELAPPEMGIGEAQYAAFRLAEGNLAAS